VQKILQNMPVLSRLLPVRVFSPTERKLFAVYRKERVLIGSNLALVLL
jgi:hypothetical protein